MQLMQEAVLPQECHVRGMPEAPSQMHSRSLVRSRVRRIYQNPQVVRIGGVASGFAIWCTLKVWKTEANLCRPDPQSRGPTGRPTFDRPNRLDRAVAAPALQTVSGPRLARRNAPEAGATRRRETHRLGTARARGPPIRPATPMQEWIAVCPHSRMRRSTSVPARPIALPHARAGKPPG